MEALQSAMAVWMNTPIATQPGIPEDRPGLVCPRLASKQAAGEHWCWSRRLGTMYGRMDRGYDGVEGGAGGQEV